MTNADENIWESRFKGLNEQYTQLREEYSRIKEECIDQYHLIDRIVKENKELNKKLEDFTRNIEIIKKIETEKLELQEKENKELNKKLEDFTRNNEIIKKLETEKLELQEKLEKYIEIEKEYQDFKQKLQEAHKHEIRRSSNENLNEFTKDLFAK